METGRTGKGTDLQKKKKTSSNILFLVYEQTFATRMFIMLLKDWENCVFNNRLIIL